MKKVLSIFLVFLLCWSLCSCSNKNEKETKHPTESIETVVITPENWQEYFELGVRYIYDENAFGECRQIFLHWTLRLKPDFDIPSSGYGDFAMEIKYKLKRDSVVVNLENKTISTIDSSDYPHNEKTQVLENLFPYPDENDEVRPSYMIRMETCDATTTTIIRPADIIILRTKGELKVVRKSNN